MAYSLDNAFSLVRGAHDRGRLAHAFLITGGSTEARDRLAAKMIMMVGDAGGGAAGTDLFGMAPEPVEKDLDDCQGELVRIVRPQSKSRRIRVDEMRELEKSFYRASGEGNWKVGVIQDAERMNEAAANAFLKTLEEPPKDSLLLLLTAQPERLLPTILSRCVQVPLMHEDNKASMNFPDWVKETIEQMVTAVPRGFGDRIDALTIKGEFSSVLAQRKAEVTARYAADLKEETARYKKAIEGDWLKRREEEYKAATESEYQQELGDLVAGLTCWMGDVVRMKSGNDLLDFPAVAEQTRVAADSDTLEGLVKRCEELEKLRSLMETNVTEALALDVLFLRAFG